MNNEQLAEALFDAFAAGDADKVRQLCAPDFEAHQNNGELITLEPLLQFALAVYGVVSNFRYDQAVRSATDSGFVEEHQVRGTLPDGSELDLAVCVVAEVSDGKVTRIREYFDTADAAGLVEALS
ncbi:MAG: nuclear transport factor 2 family protein [Arenicella sp.]|nr:nuclear transport factor 2 family protein [Arenicella sp.]